MKTTREYDFNIWSTGEKIFLTAYELKEDITGQADYLVLNESRYTSISWVIGDPKNKEIVEWLAPSAAMLNADLTDYDDWTHLAALEDANPPMEVKRWLDSLPEYEVYVG